MTAKHIVSFPGDSSSHETLTKVELERFKQKVEDPGYLNEAVERIARELTLEFMEITYGIPFHSSGS